MPPAPRYLIRSANADAGELYALEHHGQVCLHARDPELIDTLVAQGVLAPRRPPYLDAHRGAHAEVPGVPHAHYRPTPQLNVFLAPPIETVAKALAEGLAKAGGAYTIVPAPA
ncbi:MAG: hypothetical protein ABR559_10250 [Gemmatimonadota bacterium]